MSGYLELGPIPLIAILRGLAPEHAAAAGEILLSEGFTTLEVPLNRPGALECIHTLSGLYGDRATIGAGTVLSADEVSLVLKAGGTLIVSPDVNPEVVRAARAGGAWSLPGAASPTEAFAALRAGAHGIKAFPAEAIPPNIVRAWRAVITPEIPIIPVGGISPDKMADYMKAGASGFGLGSPLFSPERSLEELRKRAREFREAFVEIPRE